jgi:hypothetical protein
MRGNLGRGEDAFVDGDFIEAAFQSEQTVGASTEEQGSAGRGGDLAEGSVDFRFGLAVEVDAELATIADNGNVVPGLGKESGPTGEVGLVRATDPEVFARGGGVSFDSVGDEVCGDGAGVFGKAVPKPEFGRVPIAGLEGGT